MPSAKITEETDTAPLFKIKYLNKLYMSRMKQLGVVLESTQPDSREVMFTHILTGAQIRKKHPPFTLAVIGLKRGMRR